MWRNALSLSLSLLALASAAAPVRAAEPSSPPTLSGAAATPRGGSAFVDAGGFLMFGPRLGAELGAGRSSVAIYGRWFSGGLLAHSLFLGDGDKFGLSYGAGARGRYYLADGLEGLHVGVSAEYLRTRVENDTAKIATISAYVIPAAEVGYRLPFAGRFYADAAAGAGYAFRLAGHVENLAGGNNAGSYAVKDESSFYGAGSLELGVYF